LATQRGESLPEDKQPSEYKLRLAHHRKQS
jgi:hypothetical protein